jgi:hypothetical protein
MGYLQRTAGIPGFSKAVISFWFRVPQASLDAARAQFDAAMAVDFNTDFGLLGIVPLITFGPNTETYTVYDGSSTVISSGPISPCVIGIACGDSGDGTFRNTMYVRIQYASGAPSPGPAVSAYNDFFQVGSLLVPCNIFGSPGAGSFITVAGDVWHHVLISFDLSGGCSSTFSTPDLTINTTCPFHWAFDDVNYSSNYLWPNTTQVIGKPDVPNGIYSDRCNQTSGSYSFAAGNIPTDVKPIGIPSSSDNTSKIYKVEMAELQVFTGVTLDSSVEPNRRAFILDTGLPVDPVAAESLLGQAPDILLHGSSNWKAGTNTGTLGGTFDKTGTVNAYATSPRLGT